MFERRPAAEPPTEPARGPRTSVAASLLSFSLPLSLALAASSAGCGLLWEASPPTSTGAGRLDAAVDASGPGDGGPPADAPPELDASWFPGEWVLLPGGAFLMGSETGAPNERPVHEVTMPSFRILRTEVTVAEYATCMRAGACTEPGAWDPSCYWNAGGYEGFPVNCVSWRQATDYCTWAGGRLPSEAEWEYAARSGGELRSFPWGEAPPTCEYAVMDEGGDGCGTGLPWAVCSREAGNTEQGLCDMAGNLWEWIQDGWNSSYVGAPTDGSAWESGSRGFVRGGGYIEPGNRMRTTHRGIFFGAPETYNNLFVGFRCTQDAP